MPRTVLIIFVCVALVMSLFIGIYTLFRAQSHKKNYFLLMQAMVIVFLFGYLLEVASAGAEEFYVGAKILYSGASFVVTFAFFFLADYCNINIHKFIKVPMLLLPVAVTVILWTVKFHHLIYWDFSYCASLAPHLKFKPVPLYFLFHSYPIICMFLSLGILLYRVKTWGKQYRKQLSILLICLLIPLMAESFYFITVIANVCHIYLTPYSMALMSLCLYLGVVRFNIFEMISMATISAMDYIREGFVLVDDGNNYLFSNPAAAKMLPGITKLLKGELVSSAKGWPAELKDVKAGSVEFSSSDKVIKYFRASVSFVFTHSQILIAKIIIFGDATDSVMLMKKLESAAYIDALTGLYNRKHFFELAAVDIERALRLNQSVFTAMLDLDFFKRVNDTYGHPAGDLVLKKAGEIIRQTIRSYDLLGRYGGEEFTLMITNLDQKTARHLMERIRENMEHNITNYNGQEIIITCSIGLAKLLGTETLEDSIKKADMALYAAKRAGRNQVKFFEELTEGGAT